MTLPSDWTVWTDDTEIREWAERVKHELLPSMEESSIVLSVVPASNGLDVKFLVELGAAIMLDKPLIIAVTGNRSIPPRLRAIATEIVQLPETLDKQAADRLAQVIERHIPK